MSAVSLASFVFYNYSTLMDKNGTRFHYFKMKKKTVCFSIELLQFWKQSFSLNIQNTGFQLCSSKNICIRYCTRHMLKTQTAVMPQKIEKRKKKSNKKKEHYQENKCLFAICSLFAKSIVFTNQLNPNFCEHIL